MPAKMTGSQATHPAVGDEATNPRLLGSHWQTSKAIRTRRVSSGHVFSPADRPGKSVGSSSLPAVLPSAAGFFLRVAFMNNKIYEARNKQRAGNLVIQRNFVAVTLKEKEGEVLALRKKDKTVMEICRIVLRDDGELAMNAVNAVLDKLPRKYCMRFG
jgi:hypothetical protein